MWDWYVLKALVESGEMGKQPVMETQDDLKKHLNSKTFNQFPYPPHALLKKASSSLSSNYRQQRAGEHFPVGNPHPPKCAPQ